MKPKINKQPIIARSCSRLQTGFIFLKNTKRGFTLIELLVVIVIFVMLSAIVMASLSTSRQKGRDARRISDIHEVQLALELYYDGARSYPSTTPGWCNPACTGTDAALTLLFQKALIKTNPLPPAGGSPRYIYKGLKTNNTAECNLSTDRICTNYELGITLERADNPVLKTDMDRTGIGGFFGNSQNCLVALSVGAAELCYDVGR
jgi:prepilin-type N-terminal cleavage/methylation domain-containing protein